MLFELEKGGAWQRESWVMVDREMVESLHDGLAQAWGRSAFHM